MPTSELSDALNPNVVRQRNHDDVLLYQDQQAYPNRHHLGLRCDQPPRQPQHGYVPHRSELELAVVEPTPAQRYSHMLLIHLCCSDEFTGRDPPPSTLHMSSYGSWPALESPSRRRRPGDSPGSGNSGLCWPVFRRKMDREFVPCKKRSIRSKSIFGVLNLRQQPWLPHSKTLCLNPLASRPRYRKIFRNILIRPILCLSRDRQQILPPIRATGIALPTRTTTRPLTLAKGLPLHPPITMRVQNTMSCLMPRGQPSESTAMTPVV